MIVSTPKQENKIARSRDHRFYTFLNLLETKISHLFIIFTLDLGGWFSDFEKNGKIDPPYCSEECQYLFLFRKFNFILRIVFSFKLTNYEID